MPQSKHRLVYAHADRRSYAAIRFDVPPGTARIEVRYAVQSAHPEACAVDIGLRDPADWRGWSGSPRTEIFVTPYHATPGYLLGPLTPGTWEVILGLYDLPESGCTVELTIAVQEAVAEWLTGDLHTHTVHSDGTLTVPELCAFAREQGLDFLAITDHNTVSQHRQEALNAPLLLLPGVELTTYSGHANLFALQPPLLDFRRDRDAEIAALFRAAREAGALVSVNHPSEHDCGWEHSFDLPYDAIEIWNGDWNDRDAATLAIWQRLLADGRRTVALGGSDFHGPVVAGEPLPVVSRIFVRERSVEALLAALRAGRVSVAGGVAAPRLNFTLAGAMLGETVRATGDQAPLALGLQAQLPCQIRLISDRGIEAEHQAVDPEWVLDLTVPTDRRFYRAEVWSAEAEPRPMLITNPIFIERD